jgi:mRNA-degrading endonuclease YafQ of YafQ-DinJ toxin-antitoxin module
MEEGAIMIFNFDEWAQLYKTDPAEFERRRKQVITDAIAQAPAEQQLSLHQLQSKVDAIRTASTPADALLKIHEMMSDSVQELNTQLQLLVDIATPPPRPRPKLRLVK